MTVKRAKYHHGNLAAELIRQGAALLAERGADAFSLREVARRAGVAAAAPAHHFGNVRGLMTAIATAGFTELAERQATAAQAATSPNDAVTAICRAYVDTCTQSPGHAAVMFRLDMIDAEDPEFRAAAFAAFDQLQAAVHSAVPNGADPACTAKALWSAMHGLTGLKMLRDEPRLIDFTVRTLLAGTAPTRPAARPDQAGRSP
ncbi:MAG: TetR/AcrR family transcriptional regulator [Pseudomonadota bacterium]